MQEFTTASGAQVKMAVASFQDATALKNAILKELKNAGIKIERKQEINIELLESLLPFIVGFETSPEVNNALFKCLERCLYNDAKITKETFEEVEARSDYYEIVGRCIYTNLFPFFKNLPSLFTELVQKMPSFQG